MSPLPFPLNQSANRMLWSGNDIRYNPHKSMNMSLLYVTTITQKRKSLRNGSLQEVHLSIISL